MRKFAALALGLAALAAWSGARAHQAPPKLRAARPSPFPPPPVFAPTAPVPPWRSLDPRPDLPLEPIPPVEGIE